MDRIAKIQSQFSSSFEKRKICSYDVELITKPTKPLIHQASRFLFFTKGKGKMKIDNKIYKIEPNSCIGIIPWQITELLEVEEPMQFIKVVYNFDLINQSLKTSYNLMNEEIAVVNELQSNPIIYCNEVEANHILEVMEDIKNEVGVESMLDIQEDKVLTNVYVINKLVELIVYYIRVSQEVDLESKDKLKNMDDKSGIFKYVYSHLSEKLTLAKVASIFYMSESSVSKYCQDLTGHSFMDLVNKMRIVKTIDFLIYTDFSLNEISEFVGFTDASHLSKTFCKRIGTTPNQYRTINQNIEQVLKSREKSVTYDLVNYINQKYTLDITELDVMEEFNISSIEMNRILLYTVEMNFDQFLNYLRVNYACKLLLNTDETIVDIAISAGYNNARTFNNHFVKLKGMKPSEFRRYIKLQHDDQALEENKQD